jgi:hypothetical protein
LNPSVEKFLISNLHKLEPNGQPIVHDETQRSLSEVVTTLVPAFHQSLWMEWEFGTWVGVFAGYDEGGRQLGEANVLPEWRATPLNDRWRPFKGPGARHGHPFNVDAMHEIVKHWDDLLLDAASLREMYCRRYQRNGRLSAKDLYIISAIAVSIASFLLRHGDDPTIDGKLPSQAAATFKVIGGMFAATNLMMSQAHPMLMQSELDIDDFLQYLEDERLLLSPEMRACAGPVKMIQQMLTAIVEPPLAEIADNAFCYLNGDIERAFEYGIQCVRIDLGVLLYWRGLGGYLKPLLEYPNTPESVQQFLWAEPELGMEDNIPLYNYVDIAQQLLSVLDESTESEQALIAVLTLQGADSRQRIKNNDIEEIGANCFRLEEIMHRFFHEHQEHLDYILQKKSPKLSITAWTPTPCSQFLKELFIMDSKLIPESLIKNNSAYRPI